MHYIVTNLNTTVFPCSTLQKALPSLRSGGMIQMSLNVITPEFIKLVMKGENGL